MLKSVDNCYEVLFRFSDKVITPALPPSLPKRTPGEILLEKLYEDIDTQDVHFVFDSLSLPESKAIQDVSTTGQACSVALPDESGPRSNGQDTVLGAHKLVLCQWPYFKTMFESGFAEGGSGHKTVRIKDISPKAFQLLLRFMYTGTIAEDTKPTLVYMDPFNTQKDVSWESLYLVAHRYDIEDLCRIARDNIVANLNSLGTVQFLFRSAYLYEDLREPVIKHVAASCGSILASKSAREIYMNHPESARIFGELFEHIYVAKQ